MKKIYVLLIALATGAIGTVVGLLAGGSFGELWDCHWFNLQRLCFN